MARPARPEQTKSARSSRQFSRFCYLINPDRVFGTHSDGAKGRCPQGKSRSAGTAPTRHRQLVFGGSREAVIRAWPSSIIGVAVNSQKHAPTISPRMKLN